jgi:hypothetical protein
MKKRIFALIAVTLTFTNTVFAQFPNTSSDLWFEVIGREYSSVSGSAVTIDGMEGNFYTNDNGILYQVVNVRNAINYNVLYVRIGGFRFLSPKIAQKYSSISPNDNFGVYRTPLPLNLEWDMSMEDVKKILTEVKFIENKNSNQNVTGRVYNLPGFNNTDVGLIFNQNRLETLYLIWNDASNISNTFWHPKGLYSYNLKGAMEDLKATKDALNVNNMYTFLDAYFNRKDNQIPGLVGFNTDYEEKDGAIKMIQTYCTNDLNFKYSFYNRMQTTLNKLLSNNIVKPSSSNYAVFEAYDDIANDDFNTKKGETFYYHKEDADHYKTKNKWPVFHLYTLSGTNEVVFEVVPPNANKEGKLFNSLKINSIIPQLKGNNWLKYIGKNTASPETANLITYLQSFLNPNNNEYISKYDVEVKSLGINVSAYKSKGKKKKEKRFVSSISFTNKFEGELPLGFNFKQTRDELIAKVNAKVNDDKTLRFSINNEIRVDIRFDKNGKMVNFYMDQFGGNTPWEELIKNYNTTYHKLPSNLGEKEEINRFETKFQKVCTPKDQSLVLDRDQYIKSLNLDISSNLNPAVANIKGGDILSIIGRPTDGALAKLVIAKMGDFNENQSFDFFGTLDTDNITIAYNNDSTFKDLKVIAYIEFKYEEIEFAPLDLKNKMSKSKIRKMFPVETWSNNGDTRFVRNYKGYDFEFRYEKNKLYSVTISLPE